MNSENLNVKIVADVSQYKRGMNEAKQATKEFGNSSKQSASNVERLEATIKEQQDKLKALKTEYTDLVLAQDKSSAATKELESQMKLLNTQLTLNKQKLEVAAAASNSFTTGLDGNGAIGSTNEAMGELGNTLMNIRNLQMADVFISMFEAFALARSQAQSAGSGFRQAMEEVRDAFNFSNFDVGEDGIKGYFQSMAIQGKEAAVSLGRAFKALGETISTAMKSAAAAIASVIAVLVTFISLVRNAITTAERLRTTFYQAQKIGMSAASYEQWAYILNNVGVEVDKLSDFLKTLADEQNAVRDGDEAIIKAFEDLGLAAEEVANMSQEKLFSETVKRLQAVENEVQRTSIAYRIFGEDAAELSNVLRLNSEEMDRMTRQYQLLGGEASDSAIQKSLTLSAAINDLRTAWRGLTNTLGEAFMPMITTVVRWLTKAIAVINMFIRALFGFDIVSTGSKSTEKATASVGGYSKAMEKATQTAEKLKRTTQGFDELNIVTNPNSSSSGAADSGIGDDYGVGGGFDLPDMDAQFADLGLDKVAEKIEKWKDIIRAVVPAAMVAVGVIGGVLAALSGNWPLAIALFAMAGIGLLAMTSGEGGFKGYIDNFVTACNGLLVPALIAVGAVGGVIALLLGNIPLAIGLFALAGIGIALTTTDKFQALTNGFAQKVTLITLTAMVAIGVVGGVIALLMGNIPAAIGLFAMAGLGIAGLTVGGFWNEISGWFKDLFSNIGQACVDVWNKICEIFSGVGAWFTKVFQAAWDGIKNAWSAVIGWFQGVWNGIVNIFSSVVKWFGDVFKNAWNAIKSAWSAVTGWFSGIWNSIKNIFSATGAWFGNIFASAWSAIKAAWSAVTGWFKSLWEGIKKIFSVVATWFGSIFTTAWNNIKKAFSSVSTFFTGVWNTIKNIFAKAGTAIGDAVSGAFKKAINWVLEKAIGIINGFIKSINSCIGIINKIPGVNIKTISQLSVPKLATGGIAVNDTLAHIGEGGKREAVLPLDQNTEWMDMLADKLATRVGGGNSKIVLQVGEKELGWATIDSINGITKQTGGLQLHLV